MEKIKINSDKFSTFIFQKNNNGTIHRQFENREEFCCQIVELASEDYSFQILQSIIDILKNPIENEKDFLIFCLNDHEFSKGYDPESLVRSIKRVQVLEGDVLVTGLSYFCCSIPIDDNLSWVESIGSSQFIIVFKRFYQKFTDSFVIPKESLHERIARLSQNKIVLNSFFSITRNVNNDGVEKNIDINAPKSNNPSVKAFQASDKIYNFYKHLQKLTESRYAETPPFDEISISTYVINLQERTDRHLHIVNQFKEKPEFDLKIMKAHKHSIGAVGLWISIRKIIKLALENEEDVIIICEDDHEFTSDYCKMDLFRNIFDGFRQHVDYINGGTSSINVVIPVSNDRYWVDSTRATQFMIIYRRFFEKILEYEFTGEVIADIIMSNLAETKMILFPFISKQHNFGYSDVTPQHNTYTDLVDEMFSNTERRLAQIRSAFERYKNIS